MHIRVANGFFFRSTVIVNIRWAACRGRRLREWVHHSFSCVDWRSKWKTITLRTWIYAKIHRWFEATRARACELCKYIKITQPICLVSVNHFVFARRASKWIPSNRVDRGSIGFMCVHSSHAFHALAADVSYFRRRSWNRIRWVVLSGWRAAWEKEWGTQAKLYVFFPMWICMLLSVGASLSLSLVGVFRAAATQPITDGRRLSNTSFRPNQLHWRRAFVRARAV